MAKCLCFDGKITANKCLFEPMCFGPFRNISSILVQIVLVVPFQNNNIQMIWVKIILPSKVYDIIVTRGYVSENVCFMFLYQLPTFYFRILFSNVLNLNLKDIYYSVKTMWNTMSKLQLLVSVTNKLCPLVIGKYWIGKHISSILFFFYFDINRNNFLFGQIPNVNPNFTHVIIKLS